MFDEPFLGLVIPYAGTYLPAGWMFCQGQKLQIRYYGDLFSLIGNTFGGDGIETLALPNLCGRVAVHAGQAPQMKRYTAGETGGNEKVYITTDNIPMHNHPVVTLTGKPQCYKKPGNVDNPDDAYPAIVNGSANAYSTDPSESVKMGKTVLSVETPVPLQHNVQEPMLVMSPYVTMNYIICVEGVRP